MLFSSYATFVAVLAASSRTKGSGTYADCTFVAAAGRAALIASLLRKLGQCARILRFAGVDHRFQNDRKLMFHICHDICSGRSALAPEMAGFGLSGSKEVPVHWRTSIGPEGHQSSPTSLGGIGEGRSNMSALPLKADVSETTGVCLFRARSRRSSAGYSGQD